MDELIFRNVRCFTDPGTARLAPITLLVGENSTGKTTFLALTRLAWDIALGQKEVDFNDDPFFLGGFDQIAHYRGGRGGRAKSFEIGFKIKINGQPLRLPDNVGPEIFFSSEFTQSGAEPILAQFSISSGPYKFLIRFEKTIGDFVLDVEAPSWSGSLSGKTGERLFSGFRRDFPWDWRYALYLLYDTTRPTRRKKRKARLSLDDFEAFQQIINFAHHRNQGRPYAFAPVRTKPQRTYNPIKDIPSAEGSHIPMVLAKSFFEDRESWKGLKERLNRFGKSSGLFDELRIKPLGKTESDPFQIRVKIAGPAANLVDVGYGVSQVLPLLVDSIRARRNEIFLLQQPEVHLHPRGQAELASFLWPLARRFNKKFIIETHSDYLVDRIRMDIRDHKALSPKDVSILFFERQGPEIKIHNLTIDGEGNLQNVPEGYRKFFLTEERRFFKM